MQAISNKPKEGLMKYLGIGLVWLASAGLVTKIAFSVHNGLIVFLATAGIVMVAYWLFAAIMESI